MLKTAKNRIQKEKIKKAAAREDVPQRHRRGGGAGIRIQEPEDERIAIKGLEIRIDGVEERLGKRIDKVEDKLDRVENKLGNVEDNLTKKIDAVAADLAAHRADTEAHRGYKVCEGK